MKKIIAIIPFLFLVSPLMMFAETGEKEVNVSFIFSEFVVQILGTLFLVWLIKKFAWENFHEMLENRKANINKNILDAKEASENAKKIEGAKKEELQEINSKKKDILKTTISKAKEQEKEIITTAKLKSKELLEKAQEDVAKEKEELKEELSQELGSVSIDLVKKFMFNEITEEQEKKLLQQALTKVSNE